MTIGRTVGGAVVRSRLMVGPVRTPALAARTARVRRRSTRRKRGRCAGIGVVRGARPSCPGMSTATLAMKQVILFVSAEPVDAGMLPKIDHHYEWFQVSGALSFQRLSSIWYDKSPSAVYSYGSEDAHQVLSYLYRVRRCWVHLAELPSELDVAHNVFYSHLDTSRHAGSPTLSIITSTYNSGRKIYRPLQSLLNQSYPNWEWIIWDDSPDDELYRKLVDMSRMDMRVHVYRAPRPSGVIGLMKRRAAAMATGEYIVEVDHDDDLHPDLLRWIVDAGWKHPDAQFFYTDSAELLEGTHEPVLYGDYFGLGHCGHRFEWSDRYGCYLASVHAPGPNPTTITHIVGVPNHVRVWRSAFYDRIGKHNPFLCVGDDYELIVRTYISEEKWCHIRACGYYQYRNVDGNFTLFRNSLIQHTVHHTLLHYQHALRDCKISPRPCPAWAMDHDKQPHPKTHYEYDPLPYETTYAMVAPTRDLIAQYVDEPDCMIAIVGKPPDHIPIEWRRRIVWYNLSMYTDLRRQLNYAHNILHRGRRFVSVGAEPSTALSISSVSTGEAEAECESDTHTRCAGDMAADRQAGAQAACPAVEGKTQAVQLVETAEQRTDEESVRVAQLTARLEADATRAYHGEEAGGDCALKSGEPVIHDIPGSAQTNTAAASGHESVGLSLSSPCDAVPVVAAQQVSVTKYVSVIMYNGDEIISEYLRLVHPHVSHIYIVEGTETFRGQRKESMYFDRNSAVFKPYAAKITYISVEAVDFSDENVLLELAAFERERAHAQYVDIKDWFREARQRNAAASSICKDYAPGERERVRVIVSDVDEIPNMAAISANELLVAAALAANHIAKLEMHMLYYGWSWSKKYKWNKAFVCTVQQLERDTMENMRSYPADHVLKCAGWHCSYFMTPLEIARKITSFAHAEYDKDAFKDVHHIERCVQQGEDLFSRGEEEKCTPFEFDLRPH